MRILLTGATGLIGSALCQRWQHQHQLIGLSRDVGKAQRQSVPGLHWVNNLNDVDFNQLDVVVNLAGEPIAAKRWTATQKERICQSRWQLTEQIAGAILQATTPPQLLINGSAIGFYGRQNPGCIDESFSGFYPDFSHDICARWENLAMRAQTDKTRVCILRTGIVLSDHGGALGRMLPAYRLGLGGKLGDGQQYMSWIHLEDMLGIIDFVLQQTECHGIYNATAPMAVTNQQFSKLLAERLHKPELLPLPAFALRLLFGEMADLLLFGQQVYPKRLLDAGYSFHYNQLRAALAALKL
ncbi:TIGR01777 family oxidoreductase [Rheinheimera texasensis]|uniref:TIGR01777 family oxidoreductase n=1 Tax=Rheinheimera texasensis TaxID=306205 RepID=UPI0004E0DF93|nr:TIGR01777 family oxidoreductase [Rheinheimera texasensis]